MAPEKYSNIGYDYFESSKQISEASDWLSMDFDENLDYCLDMDLCDLGDLDVALEWDSSSLSDTQSLRSGNENLSQPSSYNTFKVPIKKSKLEPFAFINSTGPEIKTTETRKLVRKYATQSRDSSKKRGPPKKRVPLRPPIIDPKVKGTLVDEELDVSSKAVSEALAYLPPISRLGVSGMDPFISYPFEMTDRDRRQLFHFFDDAKIGVVPHRDIFLPFALEDQATLHQLLANIAMQMNHQNPSAFKSEKYGHHEIVAHHARALEIVQQRIAHPTEATSNGTIATIMCMIIHSHIMRDFPTWHSHIQGLKQIFKLRENNCPDNAEEFPVEVRKWLAWIDVSGCNTQDISPQFPLTDDFDPIPSNSALHTITPEEDIASELHPSPRATTLTSNLRAQFGSHTEIFSLFENAGNLVSRFKARLLDSKRNVYKNMVWACENLHPLMHRLLEYRVPVDIDSLGSVIQEVCRLGLLLFFAQIRKNFRIAPRENVDVYVEKLIPLLEAHDDWGEFEILKLWVVVLGAMQAEAEERKVLVSMLRRLLRELGIGSHAKAEDELRELLWIGEIHGIDFWEIYREVWMVNV